MNKVYLAGPISGQSYDDVVAVINKKKSYLENLGYTVLNPMTAKKAIRTEIKLRSSGYGNPESTNHAIFERDRWMVENTDIIFVDFSSAEERVSIGSCMEMAWGSILGKYIVAVIPKGSVHEHAFVLEAADIVYETTEEALNYLEQFALQDCE